MSSRREVLIRILALLERKTLLETKKSHIKMFKTALFDFFLRDSRASETRGRVKITPREKRGHAACRLFFLKPPHAISMINIFMSEVFIEVDSLKHLEISRRT